MSNTKGILDYQAKGKILTFACVSCLNYRIQNFFLHFQTFLTFLEVKKHSPSFTSRNFQGNSSTKSSSESNSNSQNTTTSSDSFPSSTRRSNANNFGSSLHPSVLTDSKADPSLFKPSPPIVSTSGTFLFHSLSLYALNSYIHRYSRIIP